MKIKAGGDLEGWEGREEGEGEGSFKAKTVNEEDSGKGETCGDNPIMFFSFRKKINVECLKCQSLVGIAFEERVEISK